MIIYRVICRKPVDAIKVREDADGFDDLEDYFSQEFENKSTIREDNQPEGGKELEKIAEAVEPELVFSQPYRNSFGG